MTSEKLFRKMVPYGIEVITAHCSFSDCERKTKTETNKQTVKVKVFFFFASCLFCFANFFFSTVGQILEFMLLKAQFLLLFYKWEPGPFKNTHNTFIVMTTIYQIYLSLARVA